MMPEFNPFKYNSFPGQRRAPVLPADTGAAAADRAPARGPAGRIAADADLPVGHRLHGQHARGVTALYVRLPANGSELVLFDLNRSAKLGPLLRSAADAVLRACCRRRRAASARRSSPTPARQRRGRGARSGRRDERAGRARSACPIRASVFSLSHVALPFPLSDGLYGCDPDPTEDFGIRLGTLAARGERRRLDRQPGHPAADVVQSVLPVPAGRIEEGIGPAPQTADAPR